MQAFHQSNSGRLYITRRVGEAIIIGDRVFTITVVNIQDKQAKLGINAPKNVPVYYQEMYGQINNKTISEILFLRRPGEIVVIGDGVITIKVVKIRGQQLELRIKAPRNVPVHRLEIYNKINKGMQSKRRYGVAVE